MEAFAIAPSQSLGTVPMDAVTAVNSSGFVDFSTALRDRDGSTFTNMLTGATTYRTGWFLRIGNADLDTVAVDGIAAPPPPP